MESEQSVNALEIGKAFVDQYYNVFNNHPEMLYMFYKDSSTISRPDPNGQITCIKSIEAITDKLASLHNGKYKAEIMAMHSQESINQYYIITVSGVLVRKNNMKRKFTQVFILAPQEKGHFVLNDLFLYLEDPQDLQTGVVVNGVQDTEVVNYVPDELLERGLDIAQELPVSREQIIKADVKKKKVVTFEAPEELDIAQKLSISKEKISKVLEKEAATLGVPKEQRPEEVSRKKATFLSVLMKQNSKPVEVSTVVRKFPINAVQVEELSIYVKNLPLNATTALVEKEFKRFGPIKKDGIQITRNQERQFSHGFIQFESSTSTQSAIKESPITINGHQVYIAKKRPSQYSAIMSNFPSKMAKEKGIQ
ncbi:nuclear transport factor 2 isoform X2 [Cryptomeria japonica]|uniref:nuclear transport factor 2 isoform X2 n=1 Tax=Cryptomeria japonica TaxID=3369 RepID=UPI0027DAA345|nr:nuclear transport factor 2 isoform X2 [Cryptomeria japonica]